MEGGMRLSKLKLVVAGMVLLLLPVWAWTEDDPLPTTVTGMVLALERQKKSDMDLTRFSYVLGYIEGVNAGLFAAHPCYLGWPESRGQLGQIWLNYVKARPERWRDGPGLLTVEALLTAFPCEVKGARVR